MPSANTYNFTTGTSPLPDVGQLSYNGCTFSPLFATQVSGQAIPDEAQRTVKYMEYTIKADGYVTLPQGATSVSPTMANLRYLLSAQGGVLIYTGRGMDLTINAGAGNNQAENANVATSIVRDVAWGPAPQILEFQPLGGGLSAKVQWQCTVRLPEQPRGAISLKKPGKAGGGGGGAGGGAAENKFVPINIPGKGGAGAGGGGAGAFDWGAIGGKGGGLASVYLLQFNYETTMSYGEDCYSSLSVQGTMEIPLTRSPDQKTRTLTQTVDDLRALVEQRVMVGIDLNRFRIVRRNFSVSRDKRTMTWDFQAEEKPYMDNPQNCAIARGTYSVRPATAGMGMVLWLCTLRMTYTVRKDMPRREAWEWFLAMLRLRMLSSSLGEAPERTKAADDPDKVNAFQAGIKIALKQNQVTLKKQSDGDDVDEVLKAQRDELKRLKNKSFLIDFNIEEGLAQDSKTVTFSATWKLVTLFSHILLASGLWRKLPETDLGQNNLWAVSMCDIQGSYSWVGNILNQSNDVIVDFGGG